jgi:GNAT superfamily N-acetyltransferase
MTIKYFFTKKQDRINNFSILALKEKLHNFGLMHLWFHEPEEIKCISLAYCNESKEFVGSCVIHNETVDFNIGVFVRQKYRRLGIGTRLANHAISHVKTTEIVCDDYGYRKKFFNKIKAKIQNG